MKIDARVRVVGRITMRTGAPWFTTWESRGEVSAECLEQQKAGFVWGVLGTVNWCAHDGKVYQIEDAEGLDREEQELLILHCKLQLSQKFKQIQREIKAFENFDRLIHRDPIVESVRLFVWQRDQGQCVECGRRDGLEFDHIIPVSEGGSNTERNVQLLCLRCNRSKGAKV